MINAVLKYLLSSLRKLRHVANTHTNITPLTVGNDWKTAELNCSRRFLAAFCVKFKDTFSSTGAHEGELSIFKALLNEAF